MNILKRYYRDQIKNTLWYYSRFKTELERKTEQLTEQRAKLGSIKSSWPDPTHTGGGGLDDALFSDVARLCELESAVANLDTILTGIEDGINSLNDPVLSEIIEAMYIHRLKWKDEKTGSERYMSDGEIEQELSDKLTYHPDYIRQLRDKACMIIAEIRYGVILRSIK